MRVRVQIKKEHIDGATGGAANCPLARALVEVTGGAVSVGATSWFPVSSGSVYPLSACARRLVKRFDSGAEIKPCSLVLDIPEEVLHAHHG